MKSETASNSNAEFHDGAYHTYYIIFFSLSCLMVLISLITFFVYKVYRNLSSMTLIGLQILMWFWTGVIWAFCFIEPPFFHENFMTMMDVSNYISAYI